MDRHPIALLPRPDVTEPLHLRIKHLEVGQIEILCIEGESGAGKSSILSLLRRELPTDVRSGQATCHSYPDGRAGLVSHGHSVIEHAIKDMLQQEHSEHHKKELIKNVSLTLLSAVPVFGDLLYAVKLLQMDIEKYQRKTKLVTQDEIVRETALSLARLGTDAPLVLFLDDFHWADPATFQILDRLLNDSEVRGKSRIALVTASLTLEQIHGTSQLEALTQLQRGAAIHRFMVPPLDQAAIGRFAASKLGKAHCDLALAGWLERVSAGNPALIESCLRLARGQGFIDDRGNVCGDLGMLAITTDLARDLVHDLEHTLNDAQVDLLMTASVIGAEFSVHELAHLMQRPVIAVIRDLREIERRHAVVSPVGHYNRNGKASSVYRFSRPALQGALYAMLTVEERDALHSSLASYLAALVPPPGTEGYDNTETLEAVMMHSLLSAHGALLADAMVELARRSRIEGHVELLHRQAKSLPRMDGFHGLESLERLKEDGVRGDGNEHPVYRSTNGEYGSCARRALVLLGAGQIAHAEAVVRQCLETYQDNETEPPATLRLVWSLLLVTNGAPIAELQQALAPLLIHDETSYRLLARLMMAHRAGNSDGREIHNLLAELDASAGDFVSAATEYIREFHAPMH